MRVCVEEVDYFISMTSDITLYIIVPTSQAMYIVYRGGLFHFSDNRQGYTNVNETVDDMNSRLQNWDILIRNIKTFYVVSSTCVF